MKRPVANHVSDEAHAYITELMTASAGTSERMVADTADLVGDEYLLETMRQIMRIYPYSSPTHKVARRIARLAVR